MTVPHDEQPLTRRQLRDLERQKPRKQQKEEAKAAEEAEAQRRAEAAAEADRERLAFEEEAARAVIAAPAVREAAEDAPEVEPVVDAEPADVQPAASAEEPLAEPDPGAEPAPVDVAGDSSEVDEGDDDVQPGAALAATTAMPILSRRARRALSADHPYATPAAAADSETAPETEAAPATGPIIAELIHEDEHASDGVDTSTFGVGNIWADRSATAASGVEEAPGSENVDVVEVVEPVVEELLVIDEAVAPELAAAEEDELAEIDDTPSPDAVHIITIDESPEAPILAPLFQTPVEREVVRTDLAPASFDDLIGARGVGSSNSVLSTSALVLPSVPNHGDVGTALDETGEVIITGSIDLPMSLGSTGAAPADGLESAELDAFLDHDSEIGSDVAPVSATRAISTHGSSSGLVAPPKRSRVNAPVILAVTAGVLAIGVIGLLLAAFVFHIF
ncbi:hypothetical protein KPL76_09165 [Subtercola sp. PAMC28395]|uniref:hypothetical protein n=1 Tax=Subtercola sp. PAMC28395 TaxID=2846775 RepID=UPI001C0E89F5|nr:hypothetical protein [Subtercola sp. PAMC28395]QWT22952.1 hypothetical protein KPL76_09165 [Subtercola sp. PAMC28395]